MRPPTMPPPPGMRPGGFGPRGPRSFLTDDEKKNRPKLTQKFLRKYFLIIWLSV